MGWRGRPRPPRPAGAAFVPVPPVAGCCRLALAGGGRRTRVVGSRTGRCNCGGGICCGEDGAGGGEVVGDDGNCTTALSAHTRDREVVIRRQCHTCGLVRASRCSARRGWAEPNCTCTYVHVHTHTERERETTNLALPFLLQVLQFFCLSSLARNHDSCRCHSQWTPCCDITCRVGCTYRRVPRGR